MHWDLLSGVPEAERARVLAAMRHQRHSRGRTVFAEGDPGDCVHFVESGHALVRVSTPAGDRATLALLGPGQAFGEMALLRRSATRTAEVCALDELVTLALPRTVFFELCERHPAVERLLVGLLASRVDRLTRHLLEVSHLPVEGRVIRRLLEAARSHGGLGAPPSATLPLTQQDIADLAATTRPTANAVLRELQAAGLLTLARGTVHLRDPAGLARRSG